MAAKFFVVPAPGYYGASARVISSHRTIEAARRAAGPGYVVREGSMAKGNQWTRSMESIYSAVR